MTTPPLLSADVVPDRSWILAEIAVSLEDFLYPVLGSSAVIPPIDRHAEHGPAPSVGDPSGRACNAFDGLSAMAHRPTRRRKYSQDAHLMPGIVESFPAGRLTRCPPAARPRREHFEARARASHDEG